jgi:8-oxo-dGTP pyrophosphatase MutT (NUDIX family)
MYDGSTKTFERLWRTDTVQVIVTVGDKILIQTQEQPDRPKPFISLPGGKADDEEDAMTTGKRELLEETGYAGGEWFAFREHRPLAKMIWTVHTLIARDCVFQQEPHLDAGEKIENKLVSFDEFLTLSQDPAFRDVDLRLYLSRAFFDPKFKEALHEKIFGK